MLQKNLLIAKKEIFDIKKAISDDIDYNVIYDSYELYNKSMLDYIKSTDLVLLQHLFTVMTSELNNGATKEMLKTEFIRQNKHIINHILDTVFDNSLIEEDHEDQEGQAHIDDTDDDSDIPSQSEEVSNIPIQEVINNFKWRSNQSQAINNMKLQNFSSGIHNQIMGAGKTYIILNAIDEHHKLHPNKKLYIITCFRQEIMKQLFFDENNELDDTKKDLLKLHNVIDLDKYKIIDRVNIKKKSIKLSNLLPSILVVNTDYFKVLDKHVAINYEDVNMVILDECHSVSACKLYKMLSKIKYDYKIPIIGFSATPLRAKAETKLKDIFSVSNDVLAVKKLNIISNYDLITAIKDDIILPPYYVLCEVSKTLNNKIGRDNKNIMKQVLDNAIKQAPYKKVIGWCRTINQMKEYYKYIKSNFPNLEIYCSTYCDDFLKTKGYNIKTYEYIKRENNCILLCVNRCREGSDILNLDIAIYLDCVKKRSILVALQTSGRVMRPDKQNKKTHGIIIDSFVNHNGIQIEAMTADKIITYYKQIFALCDEQDYKEQKETYNMLSEICESMKYDEVNEEITVKIDDNSNHNMRFKLMLKTKGYDYIKLKTLLAGVLDRMYNIEKKDKFDIIINKIKPFFTIQTVNFEETYNSINKLEITNIPGTYKELYEIYGQFFDTHNWYDILGLDTKIWYGNISNCKEVLKRLTSKHITPDLYMDLIKLDNKLPINPYELYRLTNFISIEKDFNKSLNITPLRIMF
jgi:superfamily II DNA or RNA helicase